MSKPFDQLVQDRDALVRLQGYGDAVKDLTAFVDSKVVKTPDQCLALLRTHYFEEYDNLMETTK